MRDSINGVQAATNVHVFEQVKPVDDGSGIAGIDGIAVVGRGVADTAAHTARIAISQADARRAIVGFCPPDRQGKGIVDIRLAGCLLYQPASADQGAAQPGKYAVHGAGGQRRRAHHAEVAIWETRRSVGWCVGQQRKPTSYEDDGYTKSHEKAFFYAHFPCIYVYTCMNKICSVYRHRQAPELTDGRPHHLK